MAIHDKVRQLRENHGWSQELMAEKIGLSKNSYARIERGETKLDLNKLEQIAGVFKIDLLQLIEADKKGLIVQQSILFQEEQNDNKNINILASDEKLISEIEHLKLQIQSLEQLIIEKDARIESLNTIVELLKTKTNND